MRIHRPLIQFITVVLALLTQAVVIQAQEPGKKDKPIEPRGVSCPECIPYVLADPDGGVFADSSLEVTVYFCDNVGLNDRTRWYKLNGQSLYKGSFTYENDDGGCPAGYTGARKKSVGTLTLNTQGTNEFESGICNVEGNCGELIENGFYTVMELPAPVVNLDLHNADHVDRSQCLTLGAGESAASQCGDLLVTHAMPAYRTKGRDRSLTLVYNSRQASAIHTVPVRVTLPSGPEKPGAVEAKLSLYTSSGGLESTPRAQVALDTATWALGQTRQVVLGFEDTALETGVWPIQVSVTSDYDGTLKTTTVDDTLLVVNRSASSYGRGWSVAGVERLVLDQPYETGDQILWVGGDGSARLYRKVGTDTWEGAAGAYRDTIRLASNVYTRSLRHGVEVKYNSAGQHTQTINRIGDVTRFWYDGTSDRVALIGIPPDTSAVKYTLAYDIATGRMDKITDPAGRVIDLTIDASNDVTKIKDPDDYFVEFDADAKGRIWKRTNRRGYGTVYTYEDGLRLQSATWRLGAVSDSARVAYVNWDEQGLAIGSPAGTLTPALLSAVRTVYDGPRTAPVQDTTRFTIDRWGAPTKIIDPLGHETEIYRSAASATPALADSIEFADSRVAKMTWSARGNLLTDSLRAGSSTTGTRYTYQDMDAPDSPDSIIDPTGVVTRFEYGSLGLPVKVRSPHSPSPHVTHFEYYTSADSTKRGRIQAVTDSSVSVYDTVQMQEVTRHPRTEFTYNSLGNVDTLTSPSGRQRSFDRDAAQRVTDVYDAADHRTRYVYDELNRLEQTVQYIEEGVQLTTTNVYNVDVLESVTDPRGVERSFEYDAAGRVTAEIDEQGAREERTYLPDGLLESVTPRIYAGTGERIWFDYDAAGREIKKTWPALDSVPADSAMRRYDVMGWLLADSTTGSASVPGFKITRNYNDRGLLESEVQSRADGTDPYTNHYGYDDAGRRTWYRVGSPTVASQRDSVWYKYDATSGELKYVGVLWRSGVSDSVRFVWDGLARRDSLIYSDSSGVTAPIRVALSYDIDGRMRRLCSTHGGHSSMLATDAFKIRMANEEINEDGLVTSMSMDDGTSVGDTECVESNDQVSGTFQSNQYDFRHQLVSQVTGDSVAFRYDDSGNMTHKLQYTWSGLPLPYNRYLVPAGSNRMSRAWSDSVNSPGTYKDYTYDANGARVLEDPSVTAVDLRIYWRDALGRLSGTYEWKCDMQYVDPETGYIGVACMGRGIPNVCQYDPSGRLIWPCGDMGALGHDGANVVRTGDDESTLDWTFVHGPGTDDPIMGMLSKGIGQNPLYLYWVTDGQGRQYGVGKASGQDYLGENDYMNTGKYAGGTRRAHSFGAERNPSGEMLGLSFFRNRFYDQETGRWTQEDPLGLAAGTNLYAYVGNNPVSYLDPFGLCPACGGAVLGAEVGSIVPGIGTVIGAAAGAIVLTVLTKEAADQLPTVVNSTTQKLRDFGNKTRIGRWLKAAVLGAALQPQVPPTTADETGMGVGRQAQEATPQGREAKKKEEEEGESSGQ